MSLTPQISNYGQDTSIPVLTSDAVEHLGGGLDFDKATSCP